MREGLTPHHDDPAAKGQKIDQYRNLVSRLSQAGYPTELRVGRTLANVGWEVEHATYFKDRAQGTWREIDLLGSVIVGPPAEDRGPIEDTREAPVLGGIGYREPVARLQPTYVIECKKSKHEWVVFLPTRDRRPEWHSHDAYACFSPDGLGRDLVDFIELIAASNRPASPVDEIHDLLTLFPFTPRDQIGHGIAAIADAGDAEQGKNRAYKAVEGCVAASRFFERHQIRQLRTSSIAALGPPPFNLVEDISVYLPLVVLEGRLFTMEIDAEGREMVREVPSAAVHFSSGGPRMIVPIVTVGALREFAQSTRAAWVRIGEFAASRGVVPGESESMLRILVDTMRRGGAHGPDDPSPNAPSAE